ncbi:YcaO-related McrA-glycine thioamidation protein [Methanoplanus sp. FWC-SCC4]|uniref:YcaO-related McrA-glycine thioamidation protein n=1 Tax=Methanochimaera problematica TaxID=2609417 RepID=A0AA97FBG2_9EURY|nr:YcaO-related McrA-glycine thioamidation protein [Methanoplanus sp. FWC-SCC4]WOF15183.1 YcaO-related McrA-glycine thioamidation protein [Methanoplanus sp. FWC-SCC4]
MRLQNCKKNYTKETHRTKSPEETLEIVSPVARSCGITRVADITGLDRLNIPVFSCIRPGAADGAISVYNGKGATPTAARVSAIMEGIERYSAEINERELITGRFSELGEAEAVNPSDLILPNGVDPDTKIPWHRGFDIVNEEEVYVPAHAVFHPVPHGTARFFRTSTNGIASGNTVEEATFHGLCEVVERDAWSLVEASGYAGPVIENIGNDQLNSMIDAFSENEVELILRDITSDNGIPTVAAVADDVRLKDPSLLCIGMGTHVSPVIAAMRAITEVAQSRATQIHGAREDTTEADFRKQIGYERTKRLNKKWFDKADSKDFSEFDEFVSDDFLKDINYVSEKLQKSGLDRIIVNDLTMPDVSVPVVRVTVPGLETFAMDNERAGERCRSARRNRVLRAKSEKR